MTPPVEREDPWYLAGWGATVVGGATILLSAVEGGWVVTALGSGIAGLGFATMALRWSHRVADTPLPPPVPSAVAVSPPPWLEADDLTELPEPASEEPAERTPVPELPPATAWARPRVASNGPAGIELDPMEPIPLTPTATPALPGRSGPVETLPSTAPHPVGLLEDEEAPAVLSAALPFAAAARSGGFRGDPASLAESWSGIVAPSYERLAEEVERLRLELDEMANPVLVPGLSVLRAPPAPSGRGLVTRVPEPPPASLGPPRVGLCGACGESAASGPTGEYRCWGCGRSLCLACFWRNGPGPGLHRCAACHAEGEAPPAPVSVSGGRWTTAKGSRPGGPDELE